MGDLSKNVRFNILTFYLQFISAKMGDISNDRRFLILTFHSQFSSANVLNDITYELLIKPRSDMSAVYSSIMSAGAGLDLGHVGTRVINTLRMEKGFRGWVFGVLGSVL